MKAILAFMALTCAVYAQDTPISVATKSAPIVSVDNWLSHNWLGIGLDYAPRSEKGPGYGMTIRYWNVALLVSGDDGNFGNEPSESSIEDGDVPHSDWHWRGYAHGINDIMGEIYAPIFFQAIEPKVQIGVRQYGGTHYYKVSNATGWIYNAGNYTEGNTYKFEYGIGASIMPFSFKPYISIGAAWNSIRGVVISTQFIMPL